MHANGNKPDIVLFMVDQLSAKWLEDEFCKAIATPNLARLRGTGVTFTNAFVSNPICMASRATLATGLSSRSHGVLANGYRLNPGLPTFMGLLQRGGWRTAAFGKVHLIPHFSGLYPDYSTYGFDVTHITEDSRGGEWLDWVESEFPEYYEDVLATVWATEIPDYASYGPENTDLGARIREVRSGYVWPTNEFPNNTAQLYTLPFPKQASQTEWITSRAVEFLDDIDATVPFFAQISYVQPHSPFCPPGEYLKFVNSDLLPEPAGIEWEGDRLAPVCFDTSEGARRAIPSNWRLQRQHYYADLIHLDEQLGLVMDALECNGRLENTYILFLSDHGELLLDHGFTGKGERHYDACIRVPLTIAGPGLQCNVLNSALIQNEDLFPTILDMAGVDPPSPRTMGPYLREPVGYLAGQSLLPFCRGHSSGTCRKDVYVESYNNIDSSSPSHWARTIRNADWRYTMYPEGSGEQLFHVSEDPDEQRTRAGDPAYAEVRAQMRGELMDRIIMQDYPQTPRDLFALGVH